MAEDNYAKIVAKNIDEWQQRIRKGEFSETFLPAKKTDEGYEFIAFGRRCTLCAEGVFLDGRKETGVLAILISLYALHAVSGPAILSPFKAFREIPGSMPYAGAFSAHAQQILVPRVDLVEKSLDLVLERLSGRESGAPGDFSFILFPLPKIALNYIFYRADEDFPPSVTCLYSQNADVFMPVDGLADVGEYMSKTILDLIGSNR